MRQNQSHVRDPRESVPHALVALSLRGRSSNAIDGVSPWVLRNSQACKPCCASDSFPPSGRRLEAPEKGSGGLDNEDPV